VRFHQRVLQLFSDLEEAEAEARGQPGFVSGTLRVSTFTAFGPHQLLKLLPEFTRRHPALKIDLDFTDRRVDLVAEGIDIAIRLGQLGDSSLVARKVAWTTRVICAAPAYIERMGTPKAPADLARHDCLAFREPGLANLNDWPFDTPNGRILMPVFGPIVAGDGDTVYRLAEAGLGIARLSRFVAAAGIRDGRLVPLLQNFEVPDQTPLHVVYPHKKHLPPKVAALVEFLVESFGVVPPWERAA
jgi:DNA-binding transcriptional LysR family regulator